MSVNMPPQVGQPIFVRAYSVYIDGFNKVQRDDNCYINANVISTLHPREDGSWNAKIIDDDSCYVIESHNAQPIINYLA